MGRKVTENWLCESYNKTKMIVKESVDVVMSDQMKKVAELFNILGMSSTTSTVDDLYQEEKLTTKDIELAAKHFTERDLFTEKGGDMLLDENSTEDTDINNTNISEVGVEVEVDVDPVEAL